MQITAQASIVGAIVSEQLRYQ